MVSWEESAGLDTDVSTPDVETGFSRDRLVRWFLIEANRPVITAGIVLAGFALFVVLVRTGVLVVGASSTANALLGSGVTAWLLTLITVSLSSCSSRGCSARPAS